MSLVQLNEYDDDILFFAEGEEPSVEDLDEMGLLAPPIPEEPIVSDEMNWREASADLPPFVRRYQDLDRRYRETHHIVHRQQVLVHSSEMYTKDEELAIIPEEAKTQGRIREANHRSVPFLTKFERSALIGERAEQLEHRRIERHKGSLRIFLDFVDPSWTPIEIATREIDERKLPILIRRRMPNGREELWNLQDLPTAV